MDEIIVTHHIKIKQKRPANATPERLRKLRAGGMKVREMKVLFGISRSRIYQLLNHK